ncbi:hypothetical protein [Burkholderia pseudomallei]
MMTPIKTARTTHDLGRPVGWNDDRDGKCKSLPVVRDNEQNVWMSYWQPSQEDIEKLRNGATIKLTVFGIGQPPVAIEVPEEIVLYAG